jgi:hypothetical protein
MLQALLEIAKFCYDPLLLTVKKNHLTGLKMHSLVFLLFCSIYIICKSTSFVPFMYNRKRKYLLQLYIDCKPTIVMTIIIIVMTITMQMTKTEDRENENPNLLMLMK